MKSIDEKYIGLNDFELIKELSLITKVDIPVGIKDLETRPVLHKTVCKKNEMQIQIEKILNL